MLAVGKVGGFTCNAGQAAAAAAASGACSAGPRRGIARKMHPAACHGCWR